MRRLTLAAILVLALAPLSVGAPSSVQNDAGTGGDGGNTPDHAAPLNNRSSSQDPLGGPGTEGVYFGEMVRGTDEQDWYSFVMPSEGDVVINFTAQNHGVCRALAENDTTFVVTLYNHSFVQVGPVATTNVCYGTGTLRLHIGADQEPGRWRLGLLLQHPQSAVSDLTGIAPPESTYVHIPYAFDVQCGGLCFQGGVNRWP
jgi:hypothetical protein